MEETPLPPPTLHTCGATIVAGQRFCATCGQRLGHTEPIHSNVFASRHLWLVIGYYIVCFTIWLGIEYGDWIETSSDFFIIVLVDAIITIVFALIGIKQLIPLYSFKNVKPLRLLAYSGIAVGASVIISYVTTLMNQGLFDTDLRYAPIFSDTAYPTLYMLLTIAVFPALFEEMAFRGFMFNSIQKLAGSTSAIFVTSLLFAIVHFAFLSLFWLIPFAVVAARLRSKYNTLWYGMVIHFMFNLTACLIEIWELF